MIMEADRAQDLQGESASCRSRRADGAVPVPGRPVAHRREAHGFTASLR